MDSHLQTLQRDADRVERIISGVNDEHSLRTLLQYAKELEAQITRTRERAIRPSLEAL